MFSLKTRILPPVGAIASPSVEALNLVRRMRAASVADADLARLLEELAPHLPEDVPAIPNADPAETDR